MVTTIMCGHHLVTNWAHLVGGSSTMFYNTIGLEFNGAENNGGIAHILSTLLMNSYDL